MNRSPKGRGILIGAITCLLIAAGVYVVMNFIGPVVIVPAGPVQSHTIFSVKTG